MLSIQQDPYYDVWKEYELPRRCAMRIVGVCQNILNHGENTVYQKQYDAIYELCAATLEEEYLEDKGEQE